MGNELFEKVIELSGLPKDLITQELIRILKKEGINPKEVTEPVLRQILTRYLKEAFKCANQYKAS